MDIFRTPNRFSDSVGDAESHDIKILTRFARNPILEILIKNFNCVGCTKTRERFLMEMCPITIYYFAVILRNFLA